MSRKAKPKTGLCLCGRRTERRRHNEWVCQHCANTTKRFYHHYVKPEGHRSQGKYTDFPRGIADEFNRKFKAFCRRHCIPEYDHTFVSDVYARI